MPGGRGGKAETAGEAGTAGEVETAGDSETAEETEPAGGMETAGEIKTAGGMETAGEMETAGGMETAERSETAGEKTMSASSSWNLGGEAVKQSKVEVDETNLPTLMKSNATAVLEAAVGKGGSWKLSNLNPEVKAFEISVGVRRGLKFLIRTVLVSTESCSLSEKWDTWEMFPFKNERSVALWELSQEGELGINGVSGNPWNGGETAGVSTLGCSKGGECTTGGRRNGGEWATRGW